MSEIKDYRSRYTTLIKLIQSNNRLIHNILSKKRASESRVKATYLILVISLFSQQSKAPNSSLVSLYLHNYDVINKNCPTGLWNVPFTVTSRNNEALVPIAATFATAIHHCVEVQNVITANRLFIQVTFRNQISRHPYMHFHDGVKNITNFQHILDYSVPGVTHKDFLLKMPKGFR